MTTEQQPCAVCGEPTDEGNSAVCNGCGRPFHLNKRNDRPGKDCGRVWVNDLYLTLEFACFNCLGERAAAPQVDKPRLRRAPQRPRAGRRRYRRRE